MKPSTGRDLAEMYLYPRSLALLPSARAIRRCYRLVIQRPGAYDRWSAPIEDKLPPLVGDPVQWERHQRFAAALDMVDFERFALFGDRGLARGITHVEGSWPDDGGFIATGVHWGTGLPAVSHMKRAGHVPAIVYRPPIEAEMAGMSLPQRRYIMRRLKLLLRVTENTAISTGGAFERIRAQLESHRPCLVLVDSPGGPESRVVRVPTEVGVFRFRLGALELLARLNKPYVLFRCYPDGRTGERFLTIRPPRTTDSPSEIAEDLGRFMAEALAIDPGYWNFWRFRSALLEIPD